MPKTATKKVEVRQAETLAVLQNCQGLPSNKARRMIVLKKFEEMLGNYNPERTYNFQDRIFTESYDPHTFRQLIA